MIFNSPTISGSLTVTGNIVASGSITLSGSVASASYAASSTSASYAVNASTASFVALAQSASYAVVATTASFADTLTVAGTLTAQTLVVQTITSSVDFVTGSTRFGSIIGNTHVFTGSMSVSGGASFNTAQNFTIRSTSTGWISSFTNDYDNASYIGVDNDGMYFQPTSKGTKLVAGNGTTYLYVTSSGVGIGTTNPSTTLHANGAITGTRLYTGNLGISMSGYGSLTQTVSGQMTILGHNLIADASTANTVKVMNSGWYSSMIKLYYSEGITFHTSPTVYNAGDTYPLSATERMRISSTGIVTKPNQPAFRAGRSSSYTPGSNTPIVFNSTSGFGFNIGGHYSTSTGRFTAPVTGIYNFNTCVIWESLGSGQAMDDAFEIKVNGTTASYSFRRATYVANTTGIGGYYVDHATVLLNLTEGQYVEVVNRYAGLSVHGNQNYCYFTGYLVG